MSPAHQPAAIIAALDKVLARPDDRHRGSQHSEYVIEILKIFHGIDCGRLQFAYVVAQTDPQTRTTADRSAGSAPHQPRRVQVANGERLTWNHLVGERK